MNRIYLRELQSVGNGKTTVSVKFKRGLNVISGASNTGKSYIIQCIDYMLGAQTPPKRIKQSVGYEFLLLEIETSQNKVYTLKRFLDGDEISKIYLFDSEISKYQDVSPNKLTSTAKSEESVSNYLLKLMGLNDKKLLKTPSTGKTSSLSLRVLSDFLIVPESRIICEESPVYTDNYSKALYLSAFKLLLSGDDSGDFTQIDKPEIFKSKLNAKIDVLDDLILKTTKDLDSLDDKPITENIDKEISLLKDKLQHNAKLIDTKTKERNILIQKKDMLNDELIEQGRLSSRYTLLQEHYENDLKRMRFVEEGGSYLNQLENVPCPICEGKTIPKTEDFLAVIKSCKEEVGKVVLKTRDLAAAISATSLKIETTKESIKLNQRGIDKITYEIEQELKPINEHLTKSVLEIIELQKKLDQKDSFKSQLVNFTNRKNGFQRLLEGYKETKVSVNIDEGCYEKFGTEISDILTRWKYKNDSIILFDQKALDITINGEPRINQGKGHRAITYAAFTIGLMKYTQKNSLNNAGFVILDSPLLNLKEKATSKKDELSETVQKAFWNDLAKSPNEEQIIIIENKEPGDELKSVINFIRFTGDNEEGRKGFY